MLAFATLAAILPAAPSCSDCIDGEENRQLDAIVRDPRAASVISRGECGPLRCTGPILPGGACSQSQTTMPGGVGSKCEITVTLTDGQTVEKTATLLSGMRCGNLYTDGAVFDESDFSSSDAGTH